MASAVTDKERAKIVAHLKAGKSQTWTARKVGRSKDTVSRIGREAGIRSDGRSTKRATEAAANFREIDRMEVISIGIDVGAAMLHGIKGMELTPELVKAYKDAMTGVAIGIDKHRLETGEATSRSETVDPERRQKMRESLDEVAQRRRERLAG